MSKWDQLMSPPTLNIMDEKTHRIDTLYLRGLYKFIIHGNHPNDICIIYLLIVPLSCGIGSCDTQQIQHEYKYLYHRVGKKRIRILIGIIAMMFMLCHDYSLYVIQIIQKSYSCCTIRILFIAMIQRLMAKYHSQIICIIQHVNNPSDICIIQHVYHSNNPSDICILMPYAS